MVDDYNVSRGSIVSRRGALGLGLGVAAAAVGAGIVSRLQGVSENETPTGSSTPVYNDGFEGVMSYVARHCGLASTLATAGVQAESRQVKDMYRTLRVKALFYDDEAFGDSVTIAGLWDADRGGSFVVTQMDTHVPLYEVENDDRYVALVWPQFVCGAKDRILDWCFALDDDDGNVLSGCELDPETGICRIPHDQVIDDERVCSVQVQLLVPFSEASSVTRRVRWAVTDVCGREVASGWDECGMFDDRIKVDASSFVDYDGRIFVRVDGTEVLSGLLGSICELDRERQVLGVPLPAVFSSGVNISLLDMGGTPDIVDAFSSVLAPRLAIADTAAQLRKYPLGTIDDDPWFALGRVFTYQGLFLWFDNEQFESFLRTYPGKAYSPIDLYYGPGAAPADRIQNGEFVFEATSVGASLYAYYCYNDFAVTQVNQWYGKDQIPGSNMDDYSNNVFEVPYVPYWVDEQGGKHTVPSWGGFPGAYGTDAKAICTWPGQAFTLPSAPGTSGHTFKNQAWFAQHLGSSRGDGVAPAACAHVAQGWGPIPNGSGRDEINPVGQWLSTEIEAKIVGVSREPDDSYVVMSFIAAKSATNVWEGSAPGNADDAYFKQGAVAIYKFGLNLFSLRVNKVVTGPDDFETGRDSFSFRVDFEGPYTLPAQTFNLKNGESKLIEGIPSGVTAKVSETEHNHYDTTWNPASGSVVMDGVAGEVTVTATNNRKVGAFEIVKEVEGPYDSYQFTFDVSITRDDGTAYATIVFKLSASGSLTVVSNTNSSVVVASVGKACRISNVPSDYGFSVSERSEQHFRLASFSPSASGTVVVGEVKRIVAHNVANGYATIEKQVTM